VLSSPLGVVRLMDLLMEREVLRNEALLLLASLTRTNAEIQKIAAFEVRRGPRCLADGTGAQAAGAGVVGAAPVVQL
jgi:hypothetical protein